MGRIGFTYPDCPLSERHRLDVGDEHVLNVELSGAASGLPIIFCHGGPGGSIAGETRRYGDPARVRLIQFDQRGCGLSSPAGETRANTLQDTIADMERIRTSLAMDRWVVAGGSWGATVALAYAQAHPDRTRGVIVRGAFLGDRRGFDWFDRTMREIFPDAFQEFAEATGAAPDESVYEAAARHINGADKQAARRAALALTLYEERCSSLTQPEVLPDLDPDDCVHGIRIALHYRRHLGFLEDGVLPGMDRLADTPGHIVHGRYDVVCPFGNAVRLRAAWPTAELVLCPTAGHLGTEPEIAGAMTDAFDKAKDW